MRRWCRRRGRTTPEREAIRAYVMPPTHGPTASHRHRSTSIPACIQHAEGSQAYVMPRTHGPTASHRHRSTSPAWSKMGWIVETQSIHHVEGTVSTMTRGACLKPTGQLKSQDRHSQMTMGNVSCHEKSYILVSCLQQRRSC